MVEQPHARFYKGLPPVHSHRLRNWLTVSAVVLVVGFVIAIPVFAFAYAGHAVPSTHPGRPFGGPAWVVDRYLIVWIAGALIVGGLLGFVLARQWWSTLALYAVGFALWIGLMRYSTSTLGGDTYNQSAGDIFGWIFWIFGVSAGAGVRGLLYRRRVVRASYLGRTG